MMSLLSRQQASTHHQSAAGPPHREREAANISEILLPCSRRIPPSPRDSQHAPTWLLSTHSKTWWGLFCCCNVHNGVFCGAFITAPLLLLMYALFCVRPVYLHVYYLPGCFGKGSSSTCCCRRRCRLRCCCSRAIRTRRWRLNYTQIPPALWLRSCVFCGRHL